MRLFHLYLRSRQSGRDLMLLAGLAALTWVAQRASSEIQPTMPPLLVILPLIAAAVIGNSTSTPFGHLECTVSRPLALLRLLHLLGLVGFSVLSLAAASGSPDVAIVRNVAGFTGLAFLAARVAGVSLAWLAPLCYSLYALSGNPDVVWTWPVHGASDRPAAVAAALLLLAGLGAMIPAEAPERSGEPV